jgi:hypothetical protein
MTRLWLIFTLKKKRWHSTLLSVTRWNKTRVAAHAIAFVMVVPTKSQAPVPVLLVAASPLSDDDQAMANFYSEEEKGWWRLTVAIRQDDGTRRSRHTLSLS